MDAPPGLPALVDPTLSWLWAVNGPPLVGRLRHARGHLGWNGQLPVAQPFACGIRRKNVGEEIALQIVDAKADEPFSLRWPFNSFGDNLEPECLSGGHNGLHDGTGIRVDRLYKRFVDL